MQSVLATLALGASLFSQVSVAGPVIGHHVGHHMSHAAAHRRAAAPEPEVIKRSTASEFLDAVDEALLETIGVLVGANAANSTTAAVSIGDTGAPYVVEFNNIGDEDVVVVIWDSALYAWVNVNQPAVTHTLKANHTFHVSFDPSNNGGSISGGWAVINSNTTLYYGEVGNTWGEYTFEETGSYSTIDVSREVTMEGSAMEIQIYDSKAAAADDATDANCVANMETCAFVCKTGTTCWEAGTYEIINCSGENTTSDGDSNGGCAGMNDAAGYIVVNVA